MATTVYGVNHPLAVKVWAKKLFVEALKATYFARFMGEGSGSLIQVRPELKKSAGDRITVGLRMQLTGDGVQGDGTLEGNEEALTTYSDNVFIEQARHAVRSAGKMSEQRVTFSVREESRSGLEDWWSNRLDTAFFNHLCGYSLQTNTLFTGNNATVNADTTHKIFFTGQTDETSISTTDVFNLTLIDRAVERAATITPMIRPIKMGGDEFYAMFLHDYQVTDMRTSTSSGQWLDIQKAALSSGQRFADNPIWTGALGVYNNVILHKANRVTTGITNAGADLPNVRRAVLCGAQSAAIAYGGYTSGNEVDWVEESFDYGNQLGVSAGMIYGIKKIRFNALDFGTIIVPTYAVQH